MSNFANIFLAFGSVAYLWTWANALEKIEQGIRFMEELMPFKRGSIDVPYFRDAAKWIFAGIPIALVTYIVFAIWGTY